MQVQHRTCLHVWCKASSPVGKSQFKPTAATMICAQPMLAYNVLWGWQHDGFLTSDPLAWDDAAQHLSVAGKSIRVNVSCRWSLPPSPEGLHALAGATPGWAGADLKALCASAVLAAARRASSWKSDSAGDLVQQQLVPEDVQVRPADCGACGG